MPNGWIKIHRSTLSWEWYKDSSMVHIFIHLLLSAQTSDCRFKGVELKRGQLLTTVRLMSSETGVSVRSIRTCLERLKSTHELTIQTTNHYSIITICNYDCYQDQETGSDKQTTHQPTSNRQTIITRKKEYKEKEIDKEKESLPFESEKFIKNWNDFKEFRKQMKKPMTEVAVSRMLKRLVSLSKNREEVAILILDQSIRKNWQDIFPMKEEEVPVENNKPTLNLF